MTREEELEAIEAAIKAGKITYCKRGQESEQKKRSFNFNRPNKKRPSNDERPLQTT